MREERYMSSFVPSDTEAGAPTISLTGGNLSFGHRAERRAVRFLGTPIQYRGYLIDGEKCGHQGWLVRVSPANPFLTPLPFARFRAIQSTGAVRDIFVSADRRVMSSVAQKLTWGELETSAKC